jgi:signal transduction histidine kinase
VSICGFADLLLDVDLPPEDQKEYLTIIRDESKRLAELSTNILTLNRIESQAILRDTENIRLGEQIRQSVLLTEQKWRDKNLDFEADIEDVEYLGNEALLKEVWLNILDNAAKFSPEGEVVNVTLHKKGGEIIAAVTDHGPGMDEKTKAHIFEQFYQGDTSHRSQGNGLGLAMVRKIVELHGGKVSVDSSPGNGSSFTVIL